MTMTRAECERALGDVKTHPDDLWRAILSTLLRIESQWVAVAALPAIPATTVRRPKGI